MVQNANTWSSFVELSWCTCRTAWDTCLFESEGGWFNFLHVFWCRSALWHIHTRRRHAKTIHAIDRFWHTAALEFSFVAATLALQLFLTPVIRFRRRRKIGQGPIPAWRFAKHEAGVAHTSSNQRHTLIQSLVIKESWREASQISSPFLIEVHCLFPILPTALRLPCFTDTVPPGAPMKLILWDSAKTSRRNDRAPCLYHVFFASSGTSLPSLVCLNALARILGYHDCRYCQYCQWRGHCQPSFAIRGKVGGRN